MIECSSAIIAHINHHPLKRVNNILPSSLALAARNSEEEGEEGQGRAGQARPGQARQRGSRRYTKRVDCMTEREGGIDGRLTRVFVLKRPHAHGKLAMGLRRLFWIFGDGMRLATAVEKSSRLASSARWCPRSRLPQRRRLRPRMGRVDGRERRICLHSARSITLPWTGKDWRAGGQAWRQTKRGRPGDGGGRRWAEGGRRHITNGARETHGRSHSAPQSASCTKRRSGAPTIIAFINMYLILVGVPCLPSPVPPSLPPNLRLRRVGRSSGYE